MRPAGSPSIEQDYLYHFSEDPSIELFAPQAVRVSASNEALVWAVDGAHCHQFYFPRDCPRIIITNSPRTSTEDAETFFGHTDASVIAAIESRWLDRLRDTTIYRYTLHSDGFIMRNESAGYWVATREVRPIVVEPIVDLVAALVEAEVELRVMPSLVSLRNAVIESTVDFDIIRWRNAAKG